MAVEGDEEPAEEYVSDPEDALLPAMRRREASDDEEEGEDGGGRRGDDRLFRRAGGGRSDDGESDREGGTPGYEDDDEEYVSGEEYEEDDLLEEEEVEGEGGYEEEKGSVEEGRGSGARQVEAAAEEAMESSGEDQQGRGDADAGNYDDKSEVVEKEKEPFAVPKAGAFYMHDDRFRENRGGRPRRTGGGHRLWESKDNQTWEHDRFEEINLEDTSYYEGGNHKGRFRGRGRPRDAGRGYGRGKKSPAYDGKPQDHTDRPRVYHDRSQAYSERTLAPEDNNRNRAPRVVRGRGPRRYEPLPRSKEMPTKVRSREMPTKIQSKQFVKVHESTSNNSSGKQSLPTSNPRHETILAQKQAFASSLNSASPPFYPSGAAHQESSITPGRDLQSGGTTRNASPSMLEDNFSPSNSGAVMRGKSIVNYVGQDRINMDDSLHHAAGKSMVNVQLQSSSSTAVNTIQSRQQRVQGKGYTVAGQAGQLGYQQDSSSNQLIKGSAPAQLSSIQQRSAQASFQHAFGAQHLTGGTISSSTPHGQSRNTSEAGEPESTTGSSKSTTVLARKGNANSTQGGGRGHFLYNGAQIIGANGTMGLAHGAQGFPGTPALLPVMQFCGQNSGGLGVPAMGLALPGYVAQPQPGLGNSEVAWLPALTGSGALGTSYAPYITVDGGYYTRPPGQVSSSRDTDATQPAATGKPSKKPEIISDELGQRQNKPRRYSEMNFGQ